MHPFGQQRSEQCRCNAGKFECLKQPAKPDDKNNDMALFLYREISFYSTGLPRDLQLVAVVHLIRMLPCANRDVLWALLRLLRKICTHSSNKDDSVSVLRSC